MGLTKSQIEGYIKTLNVAMMDLKSLTCLDAYGMHKESYEKSIKELVDLRSIFLEKLPSYDGWLYEPVMDFYEARR
jgi:hypothetical protein